MLSDIRKLFGSSSRVAILQLFLENDKKKYRASDINKITGVNKHLVSTELKKLNKIGIIKQTSLGSVIFYQQNPLCSYVGPLTELFKETDWYEWERPSRIHHMALTLEASLKPMKNYYGIHMPYAHLVFDYDNVTWFFKISEFRDIGKKLIPIYKQKRKQIWKDFYYYASKIETKHEYKTFYKIYSDFWKVSYITEFISFYIDSLLKPGERITIQEASFTQEYEDLLWQYASLAKNKNIKTIDLAPIIKKYYWIRNSYYSIHQLSEEEVRTEIKAKIGKKKPKAERVKDPDSLPQDILQIGKEMILMQDIRKKYMMIAAHYLHENLKEIGKKYDLTPILMHQTLPQEVLHSEKFIPKLKEVLQQRQRSCTVIGDIKKGIIAYSGQIIFPKGSKKVSKFEIRGMVACGGKAVGRAKIVRNIDEMYKVNHGDVIISPMTSPDLMPALRRCVGIVTDFGGITCHAAIVAREYAIPCIVGTNDATKRIADDSLVEVDANSGIVRVLER